MILEVLAGALRPSEAAAAVGVSASRYYMLELKALKGLLAACEPGPKGRRRDVEKELEALRAKHERVAGDCARYQALARAAQRALGLSLDEEQSGRAKRRRRRPTARGLRAADRLRSGLVEAPQAEQ